MPDSLLMKDISRTGALMQAGRHDSVLARVRELLPSARENGNMLAQALLYAVRGTCLYEMTDHEGAMRAYMRSAAIAEQNNLLQTAIGDRTGSVLTTFATMYGLMSLRSKEQGNQVEALHYGRIALRWVSHSGNGALRVSVMTCVMPSLAANKEWLLSYDLLRQSFAYALEHRLYDFALDFAGYLVRCEDEAFGRGPDAYSWIAKADSVMSYALTEESKDIYRESRDRILAKYVAGDAALLSPQPPVAETSSPGALPAFSDLTRPAGQPAPSAATDEAVAAADTIPDDAAPAQPFSSSMLQTVLLSMILLFPLLAALTLTLWRRVLQGRKNERMLTEKYMEGQEDERNRLAKELHDGVSNQLLAVEMKLSTDGLTPQAMQLLGESREQVRRVSHELIQPEFQYSTLDKVLAGYAAEMCGVRHCEVSCTVTPPDADWSAVTDSTALGVYRIVQEVVSNVLKHGGASVISIGLHQDGKRNIMVIVSDNGEEGPERKAQVAGGIGLSTIRQRASAIGATLEFYRHQYGNVVKLVVRSDTDRQKT